MSSQPQKNRTLCMDGRMLAAAGTGVATYARALHAGQATIADRRFVLTDRASLAPSGPLGPAAGRIGRWLRALPPIARTARPGRDAASGEALLIAPDLFRLAQVYFDIHGRLLPIRAPGPRGIMHWSYPVPLRLIGWTNLYTVHDAIPLLQPALSPIDPVRHRRLLDRIVAASAALVTVSAAARADIVTALGCPAASVIDCSQPVSAHAPPATALPAGLVPGGYLLVAGAVEPRKNIAAILAAYRRSGVALPLAIAGPDGWRAGEIAPAIAATPGALRLPYLPNEAMPALIAGARALLMPSLAEGFGLPVAEAMALGTPVVTSAGGALAETAGGAALLVDPADTGGIADAIRRICADDALRAALIEAGRRNAARFTPPAFAARLAALYDSLFDPAG